MVYCRTKEYQATVQSHYIIPPHIEACADVIRFDLIYGPSWSLIPGGDITQFNDDCFSSLREDLIDVMERGDIVEETYTGMVADALRDFLDDLPSELWVDVDCGSVMTHEPDDYVDIEVDVEDEDGYLVTKIERVPVDMFSLWHVERRQIIEALFGRTIAHEFQ